MSVLRKAMLPMVLQAAEHDEAGQRASAIRDGRLEKISSGTEFSLDETAPDEPGRQDTSV